jgi:hypothetical protein
MGVELVSQSVEQRTYTARVTPRAHAALRHPGQSSVSEGDDAEVASGKERYREAVEDGNLVLPKLKESREKKRRVVSNGKVYTLCLK